MHHAPSSKYRNSSPEASPANQAAISRALFFGERGESQPGRSPLDTVEMAANLVRELSAFLMLLSPETWAVVHDTEQVQELASAVDELKVTVAAMRGEAAGDGTSTCLPSQVRHALRTYRRRLQFLAVNIQLSDPGARELLTEVLSFDRWYAAHLQRCQDCRQGVQHP
ncbi:MAG TPA: hypothetical protein VFL79_22400 [Terriglobia bacterium]|nr:hypothetical protein [Terriglobia bacterium]